MIVITGTKTLNEAITFIQAQAPVCAKAGKPIHVEVFDDVKKRSSKANSRYWALLHTIGDQTWVEGKTFSPKVWHTFFSDKFTPRYDMPGGGSCCIGTSELSTAEFGEYMDKVEAYAASELGVTFPG